MFKSQNMCKQWHQYQKSKEEEKISVACHQSPVTWPSLYGATPAMKVPGFSDATAWGLVNDKYIYFFLIKKKMSVFSLAILGFPLWPEFFIPLC